MKKIIGMTTRKHGAKAGAPESFLIRSFAGGEADVREAGLPGERMTTRLAFETGSQAYLWITGRGRSRLVKH